MSTYAIMRCTKLKSLGSVAGSLAHAERERETPNADEHKTAENIHYRAPGLNGAMGRLRELLPAKIRKNGVIAVEYVFTASPEWWQSADEAKRQAFFKRSMQWLEDKYGSANVFAAVAHLDETTPHLSAFVCPKTQDGRLCAREFVGGPAKLSQDQDSYAEAVADLGLERGVKGSKARHQTIQQFYAKLQAPVREIAPVTAEELQPRKTGFLHREDCEAVAARLNDRIHEQSAALAAKARDYDRQARKLADAEKRVKELQAISVPELTPLQVARFRRNLREGLKEREMQQQRERQQRMSAKKGIDR